MAYYFYLDKILLPIAPAALEIKIANQNKSYTLMNDGEINVLKGAALTDIKLDALLPVVQYPFALYKAGFQSAAYFLGEFEKLKQEKKPFQFIVTRTMPNGSMLFDTNMKVSLESYTLKEDAKNQGMDVLVSIELKQYRDFSTKTCDIVFASTKPRVAVVPARSGGDAHAPSSNQSYTVVKGDTLWAIAKRFYGNGSKYTVIAQANSDKVKNPNLIYPGQVLTIPAG